MKELTPYGHMVQDYYVNKVRAVMDARNRKLASIKTRSAAEKYVQEVRAKIKKCFGKFPAKTPLNAKVTGILKKERYSIEKIIFESRPDFYVSANLYLPSGIKGKVPGVLGACGHSDTGKTAEPYQSFCIGLALKGFAALIYDPIEQGERQQYLREKHPLIPENLCAKHNMSGNHMQPCGEFFGSWRAWDGIRALDYLLSRPEIDTTRIGMTGNSGGGTLTSFISALDERITMTAPSCYVTTYLHNIENELPQDAEQNPPDFFKYGLDMGDLFIAHAPRPTLLLGQRDDFFDPRGTEETYNQISRIYKLLGNEDDVEFFIGPDPHGYYIKNREAMYKFFLKHAGVKGKAFEPEIKLENHENLRASKSGQILKDIKSAKAVFEFTKENAQELAKKRKKLTAKELAKTVASMLCVKPDDSVPYYRKLRDLCADGHVINRFAIESEPGIQPILITFTKNAPTHFLDTGKTAVLHIPHLSTRSDFNDGKIPVHEEGTTVFSLDIRGIGETAAISCGFPEDFFAPYETDFFYGCCGSLFGEPYLGGKVKDILAAVNLLRSEGFSDITLSARGLGSIPAAFAALLAGKTVKKVILANALLSYQELACSVAYKWPFSHMLFGVLKSFDLPDVYRELKDRLAIIDPLDASMQPWKSKECHAHCEKLGIDKRTISFS